MNFVLINDFLNIENTLFFEVAKGKEHFSEPSVTRLRLFDTFVRGYVIL